jgi:hypothetical protein
MCRLDSGKRDSVKRGSAQQTRHNIMDLINSGRFVAEFVSLLEKMLQSNSDDRIKIADVSLFRDGSTIQPAPLRTILFTILPRLSATYEYKAKP